MPTKHFNPVVWAFALVLLLVFGAVSWRIVTSCEKSSFEALQQLKISLGGCGAESGPRPVPPPPVPPVKTMTIYGAQVKVLSGGSGARDTCGNGRDNKKSSCVDPEHHDGELVAGTITAVNVTQSGALTEWKVTKDSPRLACIEFRAATLACETLVSIEGRAAAVEKFPIVSSTTK